MVSRNRPIREELFILDAGQKHRALRNQVPVVDGILRGNMREYYKVMFITALYGFETHGWG